MISWATSFSPRIIFTVIAAVGLSVVARPIKYLLDAARVRRVRCRILETLFFFGEKKTVPANARLIR